MPELSDFQPFEGPVLVTGATGFLGQHLVRRLIELGQPVRATGRNLKVGLQLQLAGADFRPVDLRDQPGMTAAMDSVEAVVHSGALSSVWGRRRDFHAINVVGTENVIAASLAHGVKRLVYISSPSVMTRPVAQWNLREDEPLPDKHVSVYSETKRLAEERVTGAAAASSLETVILRPKAIYGPGDTAIFPRLIKSAEKGRLPIIGDGNAVTNLTHVRDVVAAILLALRSNVAVGRTYVITGGADIRIWDTIREVVTRSGFKAPTRKIAISRAMRAAKVLEWVWRTFRLPGEPPLTTYTAGILGLSQTYDISAARRDLGYEPSVAIEEGIQEAFPRSTDEPVNSAPSPAEIGAAADPRPIAVRIRTAGRTWARGFTFQPKGGLKWIEVPALYAIIEHPEQGLLLWDTGYAPRFFAATRRWPWRIMRWVTPTTVEDDDAVVAQLRALGYDPADVTGIILSHFDPDHFGGLRDFPGVPIMCSWRAWADVRGRHGWSAFRSRLLPEHLPEDMAGRLKLLPDPNGPPISVFDASLDLFGDGSIRLVDLPGHAPGQVGAFVRRKSDGADVFLAADGCWNLAAIEASGYRGGAHRILAVDKKAQDETYRKLRELHRQWPALRIVPAHCPRAWRETGELEGTLNS